MIRRLTTEVMSGGTLNVDAGGRADDTVIDGGGQVDDAGVVSGVTGVDEFLIVESGGVASGVSEIRGLVLVNQGGTTVSVTEMGTVEPTETFLANQIVSGTAIDTLPGRQRAGREQRPARQHQRHRQPEHPSPTTAC